MATLPEKAPRATTQESMSNTTGDTSALSAAAEKATLALSAGAMDSGSDPNARLEKPDKVHRCVESVLDDNPDMDESQAWAICQDSAGKASENDDGTDSDDDGEMPGYEKVDDVLFEAYEKMVWWNLSGEQPLEKAPSMWRGADRVPEFVEQWIEAAFDSGAFWEGQFEGLPQSAFLRLRDVFEDSFTQPQGWSLSSLVENLRDEFPAMGENQAETIARNESAAILNTAREEAYEAREDAVEHVYRWLNPQDHRTTDICNAIIDEIEARGGAVAMPVLKDILREYARAYAGEGGTPERVDEWLPHYACRSTFTRVVR
jgi:hypothetical protein